MDQIQKNLLAEIAGLHEVPAGAYNFRVNGAAAGRNTTSNIDIVTRIRTISRNPYGIKTVNRDFLLSHEVSTNVDTNFFSSKSF